MIWNSVTLMTFIDLTVIIGGVCITALIYRYRAVFQSSKSSGHLLLIAVGALIIAIFYLADLFTMWALPRWIGEKKAMSLMASLHLNISWIAISLGFGAITVGLILTIRAFARLIGELELKEQQLIGRISEAELATREAEIANNGKSEFLANMSHELRTPLNAIIGFSETMIQQTFGPLGNRKYREYVGDINGAGRHLLAIINDILDLSKIEFGSVELNREYVDIREVTADAVRMLEDEAGDKNIALKIEMAGDDITLSADRRILKQILINILSNGIKFTPDGGEVKTSVAQQPDGGCEFRIRDTDIGIPAEQISLAMLPFEQVGSAFTHNAMGTGLGLPLSKSLVELHGGSLTLDSKPGEGTTVTLKFGGAANSPQWVSRE